MRVIRYLALVAIAAVSQPILVISQTGPVIATHDNLKTAGRLQNGELQLALWAGKGRWYPEGDRKPVREVEAFGEEGGPLSIPSPLIRVTAGTAISATLRNSLPSEMRVTGLCDR